MIKISEDFFSNSSMFSPTRSSILPEEVKNPRYGYSPRLEEFRYENVFTGAELNANLVMHKTELEFRKNPRAIQRAEILSPVLGFGPIGIDGYPFGLKAQFVPMYMLENFLKTTIRTPITPLLYMKVLREYNIRHDLNEMYLRPLDCFYIPDYTGIPIVEKFYHPLSLSAYDKYLSKYSNETLAVWENINLAMFSTANFRTLPLRELQRILLYLNKHYVNADNSPIKVYERDFPQNSPLTETFIGAKREAWICAIFNELEKREKEYKTLIEKPENVLFTI